MDDSQLMKGILEGCVLSVIAQGETYGYEILQKFADAGFDNLQEGTLYPVLTRLEKKGYISCRKAKSPLGPIRKYYSITGSGDEFLSQFKVTYRRITDCANAMLDIYVYTDQIEHTARRYSAWLPPIQCTLSGHQCMMLIQV